MRKPLHLTAMEGFAGGNSRDFAVNKAFLPKSISTGKGVFKVVAPASSVAAAVVFPRFQTPKIQSDSVCRRGFYRTH